MSIMAWWMLNIASNILQNITIKLSRYISARVLCFAVMTLFIAGCATVSAGYRSADTIASEHHFAKDYVKTDLCNLTSFYHLNNLGAPLTVYIEGDGFAWRTRRELSDDPTPRCQLVLSLAAIDTSENVAYIARPGQFGASGSPDCDPVYWSKKRFSQEAVNAINTAIDHLKAKSQSKEINIIGYSGGAAIAVIIAAQRNDVASLRTIAGNLDSEAVSRYHKVDFLKGSLNPIDFATKVSHISQRHFVSSGDNVVPMFIAKSFAEKIGDKKYESITIVEGTSHTTGWQKAWSLLINIPLYRK